MREGCADLGLIAIEAAIAIDNHISGKTNGKREIKNFVAHLREIESTRGVIYDEVLKTAFGVNGGGVEQAYIELKNFRERLQEEERLPISEQRILRYQCMRFTGASLTHSRSTERYRLEESIA